MSKAFITSPDLWFLRMPRSRDSESPLLLAVRSLGGAIGDQGSSLRVQVPTKVGFRDQKPLGIREYIGAILG